MARTWLGVDCDLWLSTGRRRRPYVTCRVNASWPQFKSTKRSRRISPKLGHV